MPRALPLLLLPALLAAGALPSAAAAEGLPLTGPVRVVNAYPPILPFLVLPAEGPEARAPGQLALSVSAAYGNAFHWDPQILYPDLDVLIDAEVLKLSLCASLGLGRGLTAELGWSLIAEYGGFLDPLIEGVHDLFRLPNGDRELRPQNRYAFRVVRGGEALVDLDQPFAASGDLVLASKWTIRDGQAGGLGAALQAAVSLPVGSARLSTSSGTIGAGFGGLASWRRSPFAAYAGLRYLLLGRPSWADSLGFRTHNLDFFACLEWARRRVAWLLQADGMTLPYRHPHPWLSSLSGTISLGARVRLAPKLLLEMHLSEELWSFANLDIAAGCTARVEL
jgi:hypothetical protein